MKYYINVLLVLCISYTSLAQTNTQDSTKKLKEVIIKKKSNGTDIQELNPIRTEKITQKELKKNACCNLAESFESSPTVDVSYSNAVTGAKQISMLGLNGNYVQMLTDLLPTVRGLNYTYGFNNIPGSFVNTIFLNKGPGSVTNGFESMTGQIDVELHKPEIAPKLYINGYVNSRLRTELNANYAHVFNTKWSSMLMTHYSTIRNKVDMNNDTYLDRPMYTQTQVINRWKYNSGNRIESMFGIKYLYDTKTGGQTLFNKKISTYQQPYWGFTNLTHRIEAFNKSSYSINDCGSKSIGIQTNYTQHAIDAMYGHNAYRGLQQSIYTNLIFQTPIINDKQELRTGASILYDNVDEKYKDISIKRKEPVLGTYAEYTYKTEHAWSILLGARADYNFRLKKYFFIPRANIKYTISEHSSVRASAGSGFRTAFIFAENAQLFTSNRNINILENLLPEYSWNLGLNYSYMFEKNGSDGRFSIDAFYTTFKNQIIADFDYHPQEVNFYNLHGKSYASYIQAELFYPVKPRLDIRLAYKYNDVKATQKVVGLMQKSLNAKHRGLFNIAYETRNNHWKADFTTQWIGTQRLPSTIKNPDALQLLATSPSYIKMLGQLTYSYKLMDIYLGSENITNYTQKIRIIDAANPFGVYFDASNIWGPTLGRMFYVGARYTIK